MSVDRSTKKGAKKRWPVSELIRLALIHAEMDRREYQRCDPGPDGQEAGELAQALYKLRARRYGETPFERKILTADLVDARTGALIKRGEPG